MRPCHDGRSRLRTGATPLACLTASRWVAVSQPRARKPIVVAPLTAIGGGQGDDHRPLAYATRRQSRGQCLLPVRRAQFADRITEVSEIEGITAALMAPRDGDPGAFDRLTELIYPELRRIARTQLRRWRPGVRPDTGSVVHEAYLKLVDQTKVDWRD